MNLLRWSKRPAAGVNAKNPQANVVRGLVARATTPLLPDDYLHLINPLWSARELRGRIVEVRKETDVSATVVIKTGWGFPSDYKAGQYVGIGLQVDGRWHWRSYSLTSFGENTGDTISITVKANPDGFLSTHLVDGVAPGTVIRLAAPKGDFHLRAAARVDPVPHRGQRDHPGHGHVALDECTRRDPRHRPRSLCAHPRRGHLPGRTRVPRRAGADVFACAATDQVRR